MGGGGAVRSAAKIAGFGVTNSTVRRIPSSEIQFPSRNSNPTIPKLHKSTSIESTYTEIIQHPVLRTEEWDLMPELDYPKPKLVFGGPPTLEEAKSATKDLKNALDNANFCPPNFSPSHAPLLSNSANIETCITGENLDLAVPNNVVQAFKLLKDSAAQNVLASIASDPNVWSALVKNPALLEYIQAEKTNIFDNGRNDNESVADNGSSISATEKIGNKLKDILQNMKLSLVKMVNKASDFLGIDMVNDDKTVNSEPGGGIGGFVQSPLGLSIMTLVITVIMVVVMKRV